MFSGKSKFDIARQVRKNIIKTPILMLTAEGELDDKVTGIDGGADDYLTKSLFQVFHFLSQQLLHIELMAQVK